MTGRERVFEAMHFRSPDKVPVRINCTPVGYYEHGDKLNRLYETIPDDFGPFRNMPVPVLPAEDFDADGHYHAFKTDNWGVTWEYRIFGIAGIPYRHPINTPEDAECYQPPMPPTLSGPEFDAYAAAVREKKEAGYHAMESDMWLNLFERLLSLYGDENVLCDIETNEREIGILADRVAEYDKAILERGVKAGVDSFLFGDDYGTERALLMSPATWRRFMKPRLKKLFQPAVDKGIDIHFHSCGQIWDILPDLKDIGVTSVWPQIPAYSMEDLARYCRQLGLAVEVHTDRANTMTYGTPRDVRELVKREYDTFRMAEGGAWFYIEADNGFPFANLEALVETIQEIR